MNDFAELSKRLGLLEIATLKDFPDSRSPRNGRIREVHYKAAYAMELEKRFPFDKIDWSKAPFLNFSILTKEPPRQLVETAAGILEFEKTPPKVTNWEAFIDSFRQLRNNLVHGSKFLHAMDLEDRDKNLISAGLAFISFLEGDGHDKGYFVQLQ